MLYYLFVLAVVIGNNYSFTATQGAPFESACQIEVAFTQEGHPNSVQYSAWTVGAELGLSSFERHWPSSQNQDRDVGDFQRTLAMCLLQKAEQSGSRSLRKMRDQVGAMHRHLLYMSMGRMRERSKTGLMQIGKNKEQVGLVGNKVVDEMPPIGEIHLGRGINRHEDTKERTVLAKGDPGRRATRSRNPSPFNLLADNLHRGQRKVLPSLHHQQVLRIMLCLKHLCHHLQHRHQHPLLSR